MLNQKILLVCALLLSTMTASGAAHGFLYIDICEPCDANRSLIFEIAIDSAQEKAWFLRDMNICDPRYELSFTSLVREYNDLTVRLRLWTMNLPFCKGTCKSKLRDVYVGRIKWVKKILDSKLQYCSENLINLSFSSDCFLGY